MEVHPPGLNHHYAPDYAKGNVAVILCDLQVKRWAYLIHNGTLETMNLINNVVVRNVILEKRLTLIVLFLDKPQIK